MSTDILHGDLKREILYKFLSNIHTVYTLTSFPYNAKVWLESQQAYHNLSIDAHPTLEKFVISGVCITLNFIVRFKTFLLSSSCVSLNIRFWYKMTFLELT